MGEKKGIFGQGNKPLLATLKLSYLNIKSLGLDTSIANETTYRYIAFNKSRNPTFFDMTNITLW